MKQQNEAANVRKKSLQDQGTKMDSLERKLFNLERGSIQKKPQAYKTQVYGYKKQGYSYKRKTYVYKKQTYVYKKQAYGYKKQAYFYRIWKKTNDVFEYHISRRDDSRASVACNLSLYIFVKTVKESRS